MFPKNDGKSDLSGPFYIIFKWQKTLASSGNRTRAARVAGEHSITEPTMLVFFDAMQQYSSCGRVVKATDSKSVSLWERRFESYRPRIFFKYHLVEYNMNGVEAL